MTKTPGTKIIWGLQITKQDVIFRNREPSQYDEYNLIKWQDLPRKVYLLIIQIGCSEYCTEMKPLHGVIPNTCHILWIIVDNLYTQSTKQIRYNLVLRFHLSFLNFLANRHFTANFAFQLSNSIPKIQPFQWGGLLRKITSCLAINKFQIICDILTWIFHLVGLNTMNLTKSLKNTWI